MVPLRRQLIVKEHEIWHFPEGTACAMFSSQVNEVVRLQAECSGGSASAASTPFS